MSNLDYYKTIDPNNIINPADLTCAFDILVTKIELLELDRAPKMFINLMFDLALAIETSKRTSLAIINPENPEPLTLAIVAIKPDQIIERKKIIKLLRRGGWFIRRTDKDSFIELTVARYEPAAIQIYT
ncbi:hypothetical protein GW933_01335 [Candidatus Falkowbacteria bacterium]|uniref:Uncharacterized protein n=1 Tax=Candidatus Buchananbacteria bacterium CG10_big_fil_rev_8_21_14_0_10_33_19 TaxID=1974525 RepID=A0A2H0W3Q0_9BACT|nr:hypothetical protein [Candidatus Falkowbacteria bacterium]PIS05897.1 MAG: hypothetical protein COT80_03965 [Candidatus Buchananbacteria bacterium CG10_big_fil_rev_8_21_14_0_10_33_19]